MGAPVHDAVAVAVLTHPEIMVKKELFVAVETEGTFCKGTTVGDFYGVTGEKPNATVLLDIDREKFIDLIVQACAYYGEVTA